MLSVYLLRKQINNTQVDNAKDFDVIELNFNFVLDNYSKT